MHARIALLLYVFGMKQHLNGISVACDYASFHSHSFFIKFCFVLERFHRGCILKEQHSLSVEGGAFCIFSFILSVCNVHSTRAHQNALLLTLSGITNNGKWVLGLCNLMPG